MPKSKTSDAAGSIIVLLNQSHAVNLVSKKDGVVSVTETLTLVSVHAAAARVDKVTSDVLSSVSFISFQSFLILKLLQDTDKSQVVVVFPQSWSSLLLTTSNMCFQNS